MSDCNNCQFDCIAFKQDNSLIGRCTDRSDNMCEFCKEIPRIKDPYLSRPLDKLNDDDFPKRQKLILAKCRGEIVFYGFNKYGYEDDAIYNNVKPLYCPMCGRDLRSEENDKN